MHNQCSAVYVKHRGKRAAIVFCVKQEGHDGKHKGFRREWVDGEGEMEVKPNLMRAIDLIAEAKMYLILAAQGTRPGTPERTENLAKLKRLTEKAREHVTSMGGIEKLPLHLAVQLRVCELGLERLGAAEGGNGDQTDGSPGR
jgi:hypothetical protein